MTSRRVTLTIAAAFALHGAVAISQTLPVSSPAVAAGGEFMADGPWGPIPEGGVPDLPTTPEDLRRMADLDGDPSVTTADEARMIALLSQVLLGTPASGDPVGVAPDTPDGDDRLSAVAATGAANGTAKVTANVTARLASAD